MSGASDPRVIVWPGYSWGRPMTARRGITTGVLWSRSLAGETVPHLAYDYDLSFEEVQAALSFERWCRRRGRYDAPYAERLIREHVNRTCDGTYEEMLAVPGVWPRQVWPLRASAGDAGAERED